MASGEVLTNEQWRILESLLPELRRRGDGCGRPWCSRREVFDGVLWVTVAEPAGKTCLPACRPTRPATAASRAGCVPAALRDVLKALAADLAGCFR